MKDGVILTNNSRGQLVAAQASRQRIMDITENNIKAFLDGAPVNVINA